MNLKNRICAAIAALSLLSATVECVAQDDYSKQKTDITKVKRSPDSYVYAEATCKTLEEAQAVAEELFYQNINEYVASQKKLKGAANIVVNDTKSLKNEISMPRGTNMHRVFLYVKKSDIIGATNSMVIPQKTQEEASGDVKATEPESNATATQNTPDANATWSSGDIILIEPQVVNIPEAAKELASVKNVSELNTLLKRMKNNGSVVAYDKYNNLAVKSEWYLVIYDATGMVKAVLTDGAERVNVATGQSDNVKNYPKHAALGVKIKK